MSQQYRQLLGTDLLADSRGYLNDSDEALRTLFCGATTPASPIAYMLWADTSSGQLKQRNASNDAWIIVGVLGSTHQGHLPMAGTAAAGGTMTGAIDMGGQQITNLGVGTGSAAARVTELDLKAPIAAPTLTGDAKVSQDPAGNDSIPRRSWTDGRYVKLAGSTMTGALTLPAAPSASGLQAVPFSQAQTMSFNTTTGHRHDGGDARKVLGTSIDSGAAASGTLLTANGGGGAAWITASRDPGILILTYGSVKSIASDEITIDQTATIWDITPEAGDADNLKTINGGQVYQVICLQAPSGKNVTLKHATGNIRNQGGGDFTLNSIYDCAWYMYRNGIWSMVLKSTCGS